MKFHVVPKLSAQLSVKGSLSAFWNERQRGYSEHRILRTETWLVLHRCAQLTSARGSISTPLGCPVEPEV
jgi:hypothetical protein